MNKLARNYIYNLIYQIFIIIVPLITMPYLARTLHSENMGIYTYVTSCASIIGTVGVLGFYNYGDRQIAYTRNTSDELNNTFSELVSIRLMLCSLATIIYFIWAFNSEYKIYFLFYYPWLLTGFIDISWFFAGIEDMGPMVFKNFIIKLFNIILIFVFIQDENDLGKYFALVALTTLVANLIMYLQLKRKKIRLFFSLKNYKQHITGALLLFMPQLASLFYLQVDKVMLKYLTENASQLAFYDQAEKIINIPLSVVTALGVVMMPRIANEFKKGNSDAINGYISKSFRFAMMLSWPILFGLDAIADNFIPWYLGDEYLQVIYAIWILSPIIITNTIVNISGTQYLTAVDKVKTVTYSNFLAAIMNIIFNIILIPYFGFYGAAIATIISSVSCAFVQLYNMNETVKIISLFFRTWNYPIFAALMFFLLRILGVYLSTSIYSTALMIFVGIVIYVLMLASCKDQFFIKICQIVKMAIKERKL